MNASSVGDELDTVTNIREISRARLRGKLMRPGSHMYQRFAAERFHEIDGGIERGLIRSRRGLGAEMQVLGSNPQHNLS